MKKPEKIIRLSGTLLCELFTVITILYLIVTKQYDRLPLAFATILIVLLPDIVERLLRCRLSLPLYLFGLLYAVGPMLGQCWNFYYTISWWDKLLHICGGVMFAIVGLYLFEFLNHSQKNVILCAVFALCFSMAVSVLWEFVEFGSDRLLHTDMQDDTVITSLYSYMLDEGIGVAGKIENIETVLVNGTPLPAAGYIDIGLIDTMLDMLLESLGALFVCVVYLMDGGKHPLIFGADTRRAAKG